MKEHTTMKYLLKTPLLAIFICSVLFSQQNIVKSYEYKSPQGKFNVVFYKIMETMYYRMENIAEESFIKYEITFTNNITGKLVTTAYRDFHSGRKPIHTSKLMSIFTWSPNEDFVQLSDEQFARAPGANISKVVNLNGMFNWSSSSCFYPHKVWIDSLTVVGDYGDEWCQNIKMFDGRTGKMIVVKEGKSPLGYEIQKVRNDSLFIRSILDINASSAERKSFKTKKTVMTYQELKKLIEPSK